MFTLYRNIPASTEVLKVVNKSGFIVVKLIFKTHIDQGKAIN